MCFRSYYLCHLYSCCCFQVRYILLQWCSKSVLLPFNCRMVIITKLFRPCSVRITVMLLLLAMTTVPPCLVVLTQCSDRTVTEVIRIYAPSAVRTSCSRSDSLLTLFHRMRSFAARRLFSTCRRMLLYLVTLDIQ